MKGRSKGFLTETDRGPLQKRLEKHEKRHFGLCRGICVYEREQYMFLTNKTDQKIYDANRRENRG